MAQLKGREDNDQKKSHGAKKDKGTKGSGFCEGLEEKMGRRDIMESRGMKRLEGMAVEKG